MKAKKTKAVVIAPTNKVIAYYRVSKWDTPLDAIPVQKKRVKRFVNQNKYDISEEVTDFTGELLQSAFDKAYALGGSVIVASTDRLASVALDFIILNQDKSKPFLTAEMEGAFEYGSKASEEAKQHIDFTFNIQAAIHEKYINECEQWLA